MTEQIGPYRLIRHLATGGMAEVWLARHEGDESDDVALKRILPHLSRDRRFTAMFLDEAEIGSKLRHENIVEVLDVGSDDEEYFIAMEYIEGPDLAQILDRCEETDFEVSVGVAARIVIGVLRALDFAHDFEVEGTPLNIVHRDVSPHNILVTADGVVKLIDFGVAKAVERHAKTETGFVKGKLSYMAPEQIEQEDLDRRADLFGVGALFYELLTGRTPFGRELTAVSAILSDETPDLRKERSGVPDAIVDAIERSLEKDAEDRFDTAGEMADVIESALEGHDSSLAAVAQFLAELETSSEMHLRETSDLRVKAPTAPKMPTPVPKPAPVPTVEAAEAPAELTAMLASEASKPRSQNVIIPGLMLFLLLIGFGAYLGRHHIAAWFDDETTVGQIEAAKSLEEEAPSETTEADDIEVVEAPGTAEEEETEAPEIAEDEVAEEEPELVLAESDAGEESEQAEVEADEELEVMEGFAFEESEVEAMLADAAAMRKVELEKPPENWLTDFWVPALIDAVAEPTQEEKRWDPGDPEVVDVLDYEPRPELGEEGEATKKIKRKPTKRKRRVKKRPKKRKKVVKKKTTKKKKKKKDGYKRMESAIPNF